LADPECQRLSRELLRRHAALRSGQITGT
jgi:hypothetical protein